MKKKPLACDRSGDGSNGKRPRPLPRPLLALASLAALWSGACQEVPRTEVVIEIGYDSTTAFDSVELTAYLLQDTGQEATRLIEDVEEVTEPRPRILVTLSDAWADRKVFFSVVASRDGSVVGAQGRSVFVAKNRRTELFLDLAPGRPICNDGILQAGEACDGSSVPDDACETELALGGEASCRPNCRLDLSQCHICGNGAIEAQEECDGNDFGAIGSCRDAGFSAGTLGCTAACTLDTSRCFGGCGDGVTQGSEACDGADLAGATCDSATGGSRPDGQLRCAAGCVFDTSGCSLCGNGLLEGGEACDSAAFGGLSCSSFGLGDGELLCTPTCQVDTSGCCGDGIRGRFEECDGDDLGPHSCWTRAGVPDGALACTPDCTLDVSGCHLCGNGSVEGPEDCDGPNLGGASCASLGQPAGGLLACASDCSFDVSRCDSCGDGALDPGEGCDDGGNTSGDGCAADCAVESGWHCSGAPSVCVPDTCGDALIDLYERCDGANLGGETCLSRGHLQGGGAGLACLASCQFDLSGCLGGPIDSVAQLEAAIAEAHASTSHQRISIYPGAYSPTASILLDECGGGACSGGRPFGVALAPLDGGVVCFWASGAFPVFEVVTGQNYLADLCFQEVAQAIWIGTGADAGGNTIIRNRIENSSTLPDALVWIGSAGNEVLANRITSQASLRGAAAILVQAEGNTVAMNAITGSFNWSIGLTGFPSATLPSRVDHNSLWILGGLAGGGMRLESAGLLCYRNNIVQGDGTSTGIRLFSASFGSATDCGGPRVEKNVSRGHALRCEGAADCPIYCDGTSLFLDMCDLDEDPGWTGPDLCLASGASLLVDSASVPYSGAYDHDDSGVGNFVGAAPEVGARESGVTRRFGGQASACP
ncbi:MAG: hypothetical protein RBU30_05960 [Polyangia bacterium]|jgi:cysteine-rich repeat protein|nr:hypothetical protein [Polyangia bacterium]